MKAWLSKITPLGLLWLILMAFPAYQGTMLLREARFSALPPLAAKAGTLLDGGITAMQTVNAPCKDNGHQVVCGTLAQVGQTTKNTGILTALAAEQVKQGGTLIAATTRNIDKVASSVTEEVTALQGTTSALTGTLQQGTTTLETANGTLGDVRTRLNPILDDVPPLLTRTTSTIGHADDLFTNQNIPKILNNGQVITANLGASTGDFQLKFHAMLFPKPCLTFGCKLSRAYPYLHDGVEMGEAGYWTEQLIKGLAPSH